MKSTLPILSASSSNTRMNSSPTIWRFGSGVGDARQAAQEALGGIDVDEVDLQVAAERVDDALRLFAAQQAVVDEDAGELVADRPVHQRRRDRGVDAARQRADDVAVADLLRGCG